MAKISTVDYEAIPGKASQIRSLGQDVNKELTNAYTSITEMHSNWYGVRYNSLVEAFNNLIPQLNDLLQVAVGDLPFVLETVANNYAQADRGSGVVGANNTAPTQIANIPISKDVGMRFLTSAVEATQNTVVNNFNTAVEQMNQIESVSNSMVWESEAAEAYKAKFAKLKNEIVSSFDNIKSQFTTLMNQTKEDIQATENANTVQ